MGGGESPTRQWFTGCIADVMCACIIMHNMIVENEGAELTDLAVEDVVGPSHGWPQPMYEWDTPRRRQRVLKFADMRQQEAHMRLQQDIIEEICAHRIVVVI